MELLASVKTVELETEETERSSALQKLRRNYAQQSTNNWSCSLKKSFIFLNKKTKREIESESQFYKMLTLSYPVEFTILFC